MGSTEHLVPVAAKTTSDYAEAKRDIVAAVFANVSRYLKAGGRVFHSAIHVNPKFQNSTGHHILSKTYGGLLQVDDPRYDSASSAATAGFEVVSTRDATFDYYFVTVLDDTHFGHMMSAAGASKMQLLTMLVPALHNQTKYYHDGVWMWMWSNGRYPTRRNDYHFEEDSSLRVATLHWRVLQRSG
jgi:hypothetical protein